MLQLRPVSTSTAIFCATDHSFLDLKILGQLYLNRHFGQLSPGTPPATVFSEFDETIANGPYIFVHRNHPSRQLNPPRRFPGDLAEFQRDDFVGDTPPRVFLCKSLDLLENKRVKCGGKDEEFVVG